MAWLEHPLNYEKVRKAAAKAAKAAAVRHSAENKAKIANARLNAELKRNGFTNESIRKLMRNLR
jgi:hypothetical protein